MSPLLQSAENASPQSPEQKLRCPRCGSTDTKFCYYNNYNLSQPRHLCKGCRRYWTKGGALRNVPAGGGTRQGSKRTKASPSEHASTSKRSKPKHALTTSELPKPEPLSIVFQPLDVSGCFSSLLASAGHFNGCFGSFPNCSSNVSSSGFGLHGLELQSSFAAISNDNFLGLHVGSSECWDGAWLDPCAQYPDSSLHGRTPRLEITYNYFAVDD